MLDQLLFFVSNHFKIVAAVSIAVATTTFSSVPIILNSENQKNEYLFREFNLALDETDRKSVVNFETFPVVEYSYSDLVRGTTKYNDGNYVLYLGSERCPDCNFFLYNEPTKPSDNDKHFAYSSGELFTSYKFSKQAPRLQKHNIKFLIFSDTPPPTLKRTNDETYVLPWSSWGTDDLSTGKIAGDYIRHDKSAIEFRKVHDAFKNYFDNTLVSHIPLIAVYKAGQPKIFGQNTFKELETKFKAEDEKIKEDNAKLGATQSRPQLRLLKYIMWYFDNHIFEEVETKPVAKK